ncbi:MAG: hypothetical protein QM690_10085, partial [Sphingobium sp.]
ETAVGQGAQAIMLGCTCMSPMAAKVKAAVSIPVINPLAEAAKRAAQIAQEQAPPAERVLTGRVDLLTRMVDAIAGEADENCPVCIVEEFAEQE